MRSRTILRQLRSAGPARCGAIARTQTGCQSASHPECVVSKNSNNVQFAVDNRLTFHSSPAMSDDPTVNPHIIVSSRNFNTIADHDLDPPTCQRPSRCQRGCTKVDTHDAQVPFEFGPATPVSQSDWPFLTDDFITACPASPREYGKML